MFQNAFKIQICNMCENGKLWIVLLKMVSGVLLKMVSGVLLKINDRFTVLILEKRSIVLFEVIAVLNNMLEIVILIDVCSPHRRVTETLIVSKPVLSVMFGT